jgi:hypothetical protein
MIIVGTVWEASASNPVESSGIFGKNFSFDLRIEVLHRFEPGNRVELARGITVAVVAEVARRVRENNYSRN